MSFDFNGSVDVHKTYTEAQLIKILGISRAQMIEHYKDGLRFYQRSRKQQRQISGAEYHRFVERNSRPWEDDDAND